MLSNFPDNSQRGIEVEFFGGPFDGMRITIPKMEEGLVMPVTENTMRKACGGLDNRPAPPTSVAFYQRVQRNGRWGYQFVGSTSPNRVHIENWKV